MQSFNSYKNNIKKPRKYGNWKLYQQWYNPNAREELSKQYLVVLNLFTSDSLEIPGSFLISFASYNKHKLSRKILYNIKIWQSVDIYIFC